MTSTQAQRSLSARMQESTLFKLISGDFPLWTTFIALGVAGWAASIIAILASLLAFGWTVAPDIVFGGHLFVTCSAIIKSSKKHESKWFSRPIAITAMIILSLASISAARVVSNVHNSVTEVAPYTHQDTKQMSIEEFLGPPSQPPQITDTEGAPTGRTEHSRAQEIIAHPAASSPVAEYDGNKEDQEHRNCVYKTVMTDEDYANCGLTPPH